jgi:hypothetical protein
MTVGEFQNWQLARTEQKLRELMSDLADRVEAKEISDIEANEIYNRTADRWMHE